MKKTLLILIIIFIGFISLASNPSLTRAFNYMGECTAVNQCINNKRCVVNGNNIVYPNGADCGSAQLGEVEIPASIRRYGLLSAIQSGQNRGNGLILFLSSLINLFVIICGIWTMFNFLHSGFIFVSYGSDSKAMSEVKEKLTMTAIGLAIIAGAYLLAGLIGLIFFGDATFILDPKITGATDLK